MLGVATVLPLAGTIACRPPIFLVWNVSASAPRGPYRVMPGIMPGRGDYAVAWLSPDWRAFAARRGYLPAGVPLVKRVAAGAGDRICATEARVTVNARAAALRKALDGRGRPLAGWRGCRNLAPGEFFLLGEHPWSFDGRYFGVTPRTAIVGKAVRW